MEKFNIFEPILENAIKIGRYYILACEGNPNLFHWDSERRGGEVVHFTDLKSRRTESNRATKCNLLIYDPSSFSLDWKTTYRNSKGVYFNKNQTKYHI